MARVLILGGGFGGVSAAHHLRRLAPDHEVVLIDAGTSFTMGFRKTDELVGRETMAAGSRPLAALEGGNVTVRRGRITRVDPAGRAAEVDGERFEGEAMVVALGAGPSGSTRAGSWSRAVGRSPSTSSWPSRRTGCRRSWSRPGWPRRAAG